MGLEGHGGIFYFCKENQEKKPQKNIILIGLGT
jgi:hypothetical protein